MKNIFATSPRHNNVDTSAHRARSLSPSRASGSGGAVGGDLLTHYSSFPSIHSSSEAATSQQPTSTEFRGFSTSIAGLFQDPQSERVDCCAITCCGVLQTDRDRFLLQGIPPPPPLKRCAVHFLLPMVIFLSAGLAATHLAHPLVNQILSTALILSLLLYFCLQCGKGRSKRIHIRKDLLWFKYQLLSTRKPPRNLLILTDRDRPDDNDPAIDDSYLLGQSKTDIGCAHPCCWIGCYTADEKAHNTSCCCGYQIQLCGLCAIGQEGREVERLLPPHYWRIDYITMQPMVDYYPAIYQRKYNLQAAAAPPSGMVSSSSSSSWWQSMSPPPLSKLSVRILQGWAILSVLLLIWGLVGPLYWKYVVRTGNRSHAFGAADFGIYALTFVESIGVMAVVSYIVSRTNHKPSELSLDAYIKFFAAGFCLSTSLAVFWELIGSLIIKILLSLILAIAGVDEATAPDTNLAAAQVVQKSSSVVGGGGANLLHPLVWSDVRADATSSSSSSSHSFLEIFGQDHPVVYTLYLFLNAFILAALVEEVCKYFGYRMVEHPDFMSKSDLQKASKIMHNDHDDDDYYDVECDDDDAEHNVARQTQLRQQKLQRQSSQDYSRQRQSVQAHGAAITLAMVAVSIGFTCCENLVYVFVYSSSSPRMKLFVLISRSFFPVHPIAAALQSIGVCQRDLEGVSTSLFQIVFPAVLFHGAYDFFILWIDFIDKRHGIHADEGSEEVSVVAVLLSFAVSILVLVAALVHLWRHCKQQRQRLADMDRQSSVDRSNLL